jgi:hypothetical protein
VSELTTAELLDIALDLAVPAREGSFYRVQLPPEGFWSRWFTPGEPCPFDYVLSLQMHNIDPLSEDYVKVMGQVRVEKQS